MAKTNSEVFSQVMKYFIMIYLMDMEVFSLPVINLLPVLASHIIAFLNYIYSSSITRHNFTHN